MKCDLRYFPRIVFLISASLLATSLITIFFPMKTYAIPAFSRQYMTECSTCHTLYPELNEYGLVFLKNGYVYSDNRKNGGGGEGQEAKREEKIEGLFFTALPRWFPLSLTFNQSLSYDADASESKKWSFTTRDLVLQGGWTFRNLVGLFGSFDIYRHESSRDQDSPSQLDEFFMVLPRVLGTPLNIKFGRFEPKLELWKKSDKAIVTSFATAAFKAGNSPFSLEKSEDALELNAVLANRLFLAAGVVDRKGVSDVDGYGHISYKFGGTDYLGNEPEIDFDSDSIWDYLSLTVAAYGYGGRNKDPFGSGIKNSFYRVGSDMDIVYKRGRFRFGIATGNDTNPDYIFPETERSFLTISSEAEYYLGTPIDIVALFRYEYLDDGTSISRRYIPAIAYIPLQNIKISLQYLHDEQPMNVDRRLLLNAEFSF